MITAAFVMAVRLAGPILIALSLVTLAMGLLSRTMPQMNILSVGFTLRGMVMLGVAGLAIQTSQEVILDMIMSALEVTRVRLAAMPA